MHKVEGHEGLSSGTNRCWNTREDSLDGHFPSVIPQSARDGEAILKHKTINKRVRTGDSEEINSNMLIYRYFLRNWLEKFSLKTTLNCHKTPTCQCIAQSTNSVQLFKNKLNLIYCTFKARGAIQPWTPVPVSHSNSHTQYSVQQRVWLKHTLQKSIQNQRHHERFWSSNSDIWPATT